MKTLDNMIQELYFMRPVTCDEMIEGIVYAICEIYGVSKEYVLGREKQYKEMVLDVN